MTDYARTAASYDLIATDYAEHFATEIDSKPLDRSMLTTFAELTSGPVADVGCGTGNATAILHRLGVDVFGVDISAAMLDEARARLPEVTFVQSSMTTLDLPEESLGGIVSWYSIIHTSPEDLPGAFTEFARVLAPGGHLLLAFQTGGDTLHLAEAFDRRIDLEFLRSDPADIADLVTRAGLAPHATLVRQPEGERTPQAFVLAHKPR
ncbi:class I SAM-dependent methyltransferase [Saccharopolyspora mangrovi]|uniref:Methyltransferase domain-containing protein n=1 Tax=Saccharopolyspora mangrovi TaxID=3082379 RepID=A0ABU6AI19_9PSEU|nr:methyltransferase domain-containing protein [Saccharopolyspora sp. S2-29]MEB3371151.1 methyltransferase domain-containing protein [Saccharopolyspora sp. S2-29]